MLYWSFVCSFVRSFVCLIDWLIGRFRSFNSIRLVFWLSWAPTLSDFENFCVKIFISSPEYSSNVSGQKSQNSQSYDGFYVPSINQSINQPIGGQAQDNQSFSRLIDWLVFCSILLSIINYSIACMYLLLLEVSYTFHFHKVCCFVCRTTAAATVRSTIRRLRDMKEI